MIFLILLILWFCFTFHSCLAFLSFWEFFNFFFPYSLIHCTFSPLFLHPSFLFRRYICRIVGVSVNIFFLSFYIYFFFLHIFFLCSGLHVEIHSCQAKAGLRIRAKNLQKMSLFLFTIPSYFVLESPTADLYKTTIFLTFLCVAYYILMESFYVNITQSGLWSSEQKTFQC